MSEPNENLTPDAGPALDREIATRIFGLVMCTCANHNEHFPRENCFAHPDSPDKGGELRQYSTDIASAWLVVEAMREKGFKVRVKSAMAGFWSVHFVGPNTGTQRLAESLPHAICIAAVDELSRVPPSEGPTR